MSQDITASDYFCGAGGSSSGIVAAGVRVTRAVNHWKLAIETHNTNHPDTDHDCMDLTHAHPALFPRTDIAWFSPTCTNHALAKGRARKGINQLDLWGEDRVDPAEERSRATMREVVEFSEYHRYEIVIVENVVDIRYWQHYDAWLTAMTNLGYDHKALYLNAQFFGVPQSRDRIYVVFWKRGNHAPDLDFRLRAVCSKHGEISAVQAWKKPGFPWGRYGTRRQYIYICPHCHAPVEPYTTPASAAIDWSLPSQRIGDRKTPLKPKTIQRILAGLKKFSRPLVMDTVYGDGRARAKPTDEPLPTQTQRQSFALVTPFIATLRKDNHASSVDEPLATVTSEGGHHALATPPFLVILKNSWSADGKYTLPPRGIDDPLTTIVASASQHGLVIPPMLLNYYNNETDPRSVNEPIYTIATRNNPALVVPPLVVSTNYFDDRCVDVNEPLPTQATANKLALLQPFLMSHYGNNAVYASTNQALPGITTVQRHSLITPEEMLDDCGFRMLEPSELKLGMSFPESYIILGNKRDQVKQVGNAVCPNVAQIIVERCVESLL